MEITERVLKEIYPHSRYEDRKKFLKPLNDTAALLDVDTPLRLAAFLAQTGHESAELRCLSENLNYSANSLRRVFGKYFAGDEPERFAYKPEAVANRVYAGRMGNGDENSGDGWRYRGRGLIQITGRYNYSVLSEALKEDFINDPDKLLYPCYAALSSGWFWKSKGLNPLSDRLAEPSSEKEVFRKITKIINGGYNGLEHRWNLYMRAKKVIM